MKKRLTTTTVTAAALTAAALLAVYCSQYDFDIDKTPGVVTPPPASYTVTYNANGGTGAPASQTANVGTAITLSTTQPTRAGYTFVNWNTAADGNGTSYNPGASYTAGVSVTLYAQWRSETVIVTPGESYTETGGGLNFKMIKVEGGTFTMGCTAEQGSDCWSDESPTSQVTLSDFYIGEFEVTQKLWKAVMNNANPSYFKGDSLPVETVSWNDIVDVFIPALNEKTGKNYRLPTEAEWEYAARGGHNSVNHQRGSYYKYAGGDVIDSVAWYSSNSGSRTHEVGTKAPNELGIYDMSGNVWEWVQDWYGSYTNTAKTDPTGPAQGSSRVYRGGSWYDGARRARVSNRGSADPGIRGNVIGFRLVLSSSSP